MEDRILKGAAALYTEKNKKPIWFLVKQDKEGPWTLPETKANKKESSVSSIIRLLGEGPGGRVRVLEEAGRSRTRITVGDKKVPQDTVYYLILHKSGEEILGFEETGWFTLAQAIRKLQTQTEKKMLRLANKELKIWKKKRAEARKLLKEEKAKQI